MLNSMRILAFLGLFLLFSCSNNTTANNTTTKNSDALKAENVIDSQIAVNRQCNFYDSIIASIDNDSSKYSVLEYKYFPLRHERAQDWADSTDSVKVANDNRDFDSVTIKVYHDKNTLRKIKCGCYAYYFDSRGKLFGELSEWKSEYESRHDVTIYVDSGFHFSRKDNLYKKDDMHEDFCMSILDVKEIDDMMQFFKGINYSFSNIRYSDEPILRMLKRSALRTLPSKNSHEVAPIDIDTELYLLGTSKNQDTVDGKVWIWYKVKTKSGVSGWVFGHPETVEIPEYD
jgi:hypothetical protein